MQDGERDECVTSLAVLLREEICGGVLGCQREVSDEACDDRARSFHDSSGEQGLPDPKGGEGAVNERWS